MKNFLVILIPVMFIGAGCAPSGNNKSQFYEYDGGMVNLSQVADISTQAMVTVNIKPRKARAAEGTYEQELYKAHVVFCDEWIPDALSYTGGIPDSVENFKVITEKIANRVTYEVLETCEIEIVAEATIKLDRFLINQERGRYVLPPLEEAVASNNALPRIITNGIVSNISQPTTWVATYNELRQKVRL